LQKFLLYNYSTLNYECISFLSEDEATVTKQTKSGSGPVNQAALQMCTALNKVDKNRSLSFNALY